LNPGTGNGPGADGSAIQSPDLAAIMDQIEGMVTAPSSLASLADLKAKIQQLVDAVMLAWDARDTTSTGVAQPQLDSPKAAGVKVAIAEARKTPAPDVRKYL
jgi:hypothetical protein